MKKSLVVLLTLGLVTSVSACDIRKSSTIRAFKKLTGYSQGRPGYVVDHIIPLACNGPDSVDNMQWQTIADAKAKDKVELKSCKVCKTKKGD